MTRTTSWALFVLLCGGGCGHVEEAGDGGPDASEADAGADADADGDSDVAPGDGALTAGRFLRDDEGRAVILRGAEYADLAWYWDVGARPFGDEDAARFRSWGFDQLRVLFRWSHLEPQPGAYSDDYLGAIEEVVDVANRAGLYVVLEPDQGGWAECFPRSAGTVCASDAECSPGVQTCVDGICSPFKVGHGLPEWLCSGFYEPNDGGRARMIRDFWSGAPDPLDPAITMKARWTAMMLRVAERLGDRPMVGYAPMNEPSTGDLEPESFELSYEYPYWEELAASLRSVAPRSVFFYTGVWGLYSWVHTSPSIPNRVHGVHVYPQGTWNCESFPTREEAEAELGCRWGRCGAETAASRAEALWVGEWGACTAVEGYDRYLAEMTLLLDARMASWAYFVYGAGDYFEMLDASGEERPLVLHALDRAYPRATAGTPLGFWFDPDHRLYVMVWQEQAGVTGETVVYVPARHYPDGFEVLGTDAEGTWSYRWDEADRLLHVSADPATEVHTLVVQPPGGVLRTECSSDADCPVSGCYRLEPFGVGICAESCTEDAACPTGMSCAGRKLTEMTGHEGFCVEPCESDSDCPGAGRCERLGPLAMCRLAY